jgi:glucokinase
LPLSFLLTLIKKNRCQKASYLSAQLDQYRSMPLLAIDLGGTKLALAVFSQEGDLLYEENIKLDKRKGTEVGRLMASAVAANLDRQRNKGEGIEAIGISVPGIYHKNEGTVWAPNIQGWESYPLLKEIRSVAGSIPVTIDSDRACYILGEWWKGVARNCRDAIFLAVGTGIGAGILTGGKILHGANGIAGAIGWMALERPFQHDYKDFGGFESRASGEGIARTARKIISEKKEYDGSLKTKSPEALTALDVFEAYEKGDAVAEQVLHHCIEVWGMAVANLISLFNPQKIVFGGGVFGPGVKFIPDIKKEAMRWAQPVSMQYVTIETSALGARAGLYGAAWIAKQKF